MNLDTWTATKVMTTATRGTPAQAVSFQDVAFGTVAGKSAFVAVGGQVIATSLDGGASWTAAKSSGNFSAVASGNGVFVAVGGHRTSWNGLMWTPEPPHLIGVVLQAIAYGKRRWRDGLFVAVGNAGTIMTTSDGVSWTTATSGISVNLQAIAYGNQRFVAAAGSKILISRDGVEWKTHIIRSIGNPIPTLAFGDGRFMLADNSGKTRTSLNGLAWTPPVSVGTTVQVLGIVYAHDTWVATDAAGGIYTSATGAAWMKRPYTALPANPSPFLGGVAYGAKRCLAVGNDGQVVRSEEYP